MHGKGSLGCKRATGNWQRSKRDANIHITPEQFAKPYRTCADRLQLGLGPRGLTTAGKLTHFLSGDTYKKNISIIMHR